MGIEEITVRMASFRDESDGRQFHGPREMAVAVAVEAGELLEHFNGKTPAQCDEVAQRIRDVIAEELADVATLLFEMADNPGLNLGRAIDAKLALNALKHPVERARGSYRKYDEL